MSAAIRYRWHLRLAVGACAAGGVLALSPSSGVGAITTPADLLPDLVQEPPQNIGISRVAGRDLLGFRSAVFNAGDGPLIVNARRPNRLVQDMSAEQVIRRADGSSRTVGDIGLLRYVRSPDHSHWHYFPFERYELRSEGTTRGIVRDRKSGFCLGDRYRAEPRPRGAVEAPRYTGRCGLGAPTRLSVTEGISVGWGDDYAAYLDGQHIDVTDVPSGRYELVHIVNARGRILERDRSNNVASRRIELRRTRGRLIVRILAPRPALSGQAR